MNTPTIIMTVIVAVIVGLIIYREIKNRKKGKHSCSCGGSCQSCGMGNICQENKKGLQ